MFEKEAEDKAFEKYPLPKNWDSIDLARNTKYEEGFKDGAEFGYNKANEWHDLRKNPNDLPKDTDSLYLVRVYTWDSNLHDFYKKYSFHIPTVCYWNGKRFIALDNMAYSNAISDSIAWKEIVLPELKETK